MSPLVFKWFPINIQIFYSLKWQSFLCIWFSWITNLAIFKFTLLVFNYNFGTVQVLMVYCFHWINVRFFWTCICKNCLVFIPWKIKTSDNILHIQSAQCQFKRNQYSIMGQFRKFLRQSIIFSVFTDCVASCQMRLRKPEGRVLPYKRLMGMCRWMGSHFHDWIDYNGVAFSESY